MSLRVPREKVEALLKMLKFDKKSGKWKGKTLASIKLGLSRPTIDKVLELYPDGVPDKAKKMIPKYYEDFAETEIAKKIRAYYWDAGLKDLSSRGRTVYGVVREAFKVLKGKDPMFFDEDDYLVFWGTPEKPPHPEFIDPQTNMLEFGKATSLRMCMKLSGKGALTDDLRFSTKGLQREAGQKKKWYLSTEDIIQVAGVIREVDTLLLTLLGILFGGRFSGLSELKVEDIDYEAEVIDLYEPKVKKRIEKLLPTRKVLDLVAMYIEDFKITDKLFKWDIDEFNKRLKLASKEAGLPFEMTTHILKHTAITQMSLHGVDIDVTEDYVGTEARTIKAFYRGGGEKKIRAQIRGEAFEFEPWNKYVERLLPYFEERYSYLKPLCKVVDGIIQEVKP